MNLKFSPYVQKYQIPDEPKKLLFLTNNTKNITKECLEVNENTINDLTKEKLKLLFPTPESIIEGWIDVSDNTLMKSNISDSSYSRSKKIRDFLTKNVEWPNLRQDESYAKYLLKFLYWEEELIKNLKIDCKYNKMEQIKEIWIEIFYSKDGVFEYSLKRIFDIFYENVSNKRKIVPGNFKYNLIDLLWLPTNYYVMQDKNIKNKDTIKFLSKRLFNRENFFNEKEEVIYNIEYEKDILKKSLLDWKTKKDDIVKCIYKKYIKDNLKCISSEEWYLNSNFFWEINFNFLYWLLPKEFELITPAEKQSIFPFNEKIANVFKYLLGDEYKYIIKGVQGMKNSKKKNKVKVKKNTNPEFTINPKSKWKIGPESIWKDDLKSFFPITLLLSENWKAKELSRAVTLNVNFKTTPTIQEYFDSAVERWIINISTFEGYNKKNWTELNESLVEKLAIYLYKEEAINLIKKWKENIEPVKNTIFIGTKEPVNIEPQNEIDTDVLKKQWYKISKAHKKLINWIEVDEEWEKEFWKINIEIALQLPVLLEKNELELDELEINDLKSIQNKDVSFIKNYISSEF